MTMGAEFGEENRAIAERVGNQDDDEEREDEDGDEERTSTGGGPPLTETGQGPTAEAEREQERRRRRRERRDIFQPDEPTTVISPEGESVDIEDLPGIEERRERLEDERLDEEQLSERISRRRRLGLDETELLDPDEERFTTRLDLDTGEPIETFAETRGEQRFRQGQEAALADQFGGGTQGELSAREERRRFDLARREWAEQAFSKALDFADVLDNAGVPESEQRQQMEAFLERDFDNFVGQRAEILTGDLPARERSLFARRVLNEDRKRDDFEAIPKVRGGDGSFITQSEFDALTPQQQQVFTRQGREALRTFTNEFNQSLVTGGQPSGAFLPPPPTGFGAGEPITQDISGAPLTPTGIPLAEARRQSIINQLRNDFKLVFGINQGQELTPQQELQFQQSVSSFFPDVGVPGIEQRVTESFRTGEPVNVDIERGLTPIFGTVSGAFEEAEQFPNQTNFQRAVGIGTLTLSAVGDALFVFGAGRGIGMAVRSGSNPTASFIASSADEAVPLLRSTAQQGRNVDIVIPAPRTDAQIDEVVNTLREVSNNPELLSRVPRIRLEAPATPEGIAQLNKLDDATRAFPNIQNKIEGTIIVDRALSGSEQASLANAIQRAGIREVTIKQVARPASELDELNLRESARSIADADKTRDFNTVLKDLRGSFSTNTNIEDVSASAVGLETRLSVKGIKTTGQFERISPTKEIPSNIAREVVIDPTFNEGPTRIQFGQGGPGLPGTPRGASIPGDVSGQSTIGVITPTRSTPTASSGGVFGTGSPTRLSIVSSVVDGPLPVTGIAPTIIPTGEPVTQPERSAIPTIDFEPEIIPGVTTFPKPTEPTQPTPTEPPAAITQPVITPTPTPQIGTPTFPTVVPITPPTPQPEPELTPAPEPIQTPQQQPLTLPAPLATPQISPSQGPTGQVNPIPESSPSPDDEPFDDPLEEPVISPEPEPEPQRQPPPLGTPLAVEQGITESGIRRTPDDDLNLDEEMDELARPEQSPLVQGFRVDLQDDPESPEDDLYVVANRETGETQFSTEPVASIPTTGPDENQSLRTITTDDQEHPERIIQVGDRTYALNDQTLEQINELESEIGRPLTVQEREMMALSVSDDDAASAIERRVDNSDDESELSFASDGDSGMSDLDPINDSEIVAGDSQEQEGRGFNVGRFNINASGGNLNISTRDNEDAERVRESPFPVLDSFNKRRRKLDPNRRLARRFK